MIMQGSRVSIRDSNKTGTVLDIKDKFAQISIDSQSEWQPLDNLIDISDKMLNRLIEGDTAEPLEFILAVDAQRLMTGYRFNPYVLASSTKITIFPHQINEVTWGIDNQRIMIADEVGLGKTIIAALIVNELKARGLADKVLYVVPKPLVKKWQDELKTKFEANPDILDSSYFKAHKDPFKLDRYDYVTSMDFLKQEEYSRLIRNVDMVVVDEVHRFKPGNNRYALGEILGEKTKFMIFLTATPHDGKDENFTSRMKLLDPFVEGIQSAAHLWKRHVKEEVVDMEGKQVFPARTTKTVNTELTNNELGIHRMLDDYIDSIKVTDKQNAGAVRFLATILRKRASSSLHSLRKTLENRRSNLGTAQGAKPPAYDIDGDYDYEDQDNSYEYYWTGCDMDAEKREITGIIQAIDRTHTDSKFDNLVGSIQSIKSNDAESKILLFTEYRTTLDYLEGKLGKMYKVGRIDGTMNMDARWEMQKDFKNDLDILLCTDAAAEGVDMQFCHIEFNYDLPWNPNRLEQRMGRIHRIGQIHDVYYYNFVTDKDNTIDGMIHDLLFQKLEAIKVALGNDSVFDVLGTIMDSDMMDRLYEELRSMPREEWKPKIMARLDEIERTRERVRQQIGDLLNGHKLDRTILDNFKEIKKTAIDSGDVGRFLEVWTNYNDGVYKQHGDSVSIKMPVRMASKCGGELYGALDVKTAQRRNIDYIALGNKNVQRILEDAMQDGVVTALGHPKKSGLFCVYNRSVTDGDGRKRDSETVAVFCNEDGVASPVDVNSIWDYGTTQQPQNNTGLIAKWKELTYEKIEEDSKQFYDTASKKLDNMLQTAKRAATISASTYIEKQNEKKREWEAKRYDSPRFSLLIKDAERKIAKKVQEVEEFKEKLNRRYASRLQIDMVAMATVTPESDANARTESDLAGMKIVLDMERKRARTEDRKLVKDVSLRDCGYDVETADRHIEVKSFQGYPSPRLSSHEWETAGKYGDEYWLYVIENVHGNYKVHEIQDPHTRLQDIIKKEAATSYDFVFSWKDWKGVSG